MDELFQKNCFIEGLLTFHSVDGQKRGQSGRLVSSGWIRIVVGLDIRPEFG